MNREDEIFWGEFDDPISPDDPTKVVQLKWLSQSYNWYSDFLDSKLANGVMWGLFASAVFLICYAIIHLAML